MKLLKNQTKLNYQERDYSNGASDFYLKQIKLIQVHTINNQQIIMKNTKDLI